MTNRLKKIDSWKVIIFLIFLFIVLFYAGNIYYKLQNKYADYSKSIYIITEFVTYDKKGINYYEINYKGNIRKIEPFESDKYVSIYLKDCFDAYIDREKNKVLNEFKEKNCQIIDSQNSNTKYTKLKDETLKNVIIEMSKLEYEKFSSKIYIVNENYYVIVNNNVNMWDPHNLYYYDEDNNQLKLIYKFDGEDVIGIKEKEPFIFNKEES